MHMPAPERCKKCGHSQHVDGIRCPASKYQCRNCHTYGHSSRLCYKKNHVTRKGFLESRSPKAHGLQIGPVYTQDSIGDQSEDSFKPVCMFK